MFFSIARFFIRIYINIFFKIEVKGLENIPKIGGAIICSNHISNFDPAILLAVAKRKINFFAKKELFKNKFVSFFLKKLGAFPADRDKTDIKALKTSINLLKKGELLGIFAQGKRAKSNEEIKLKSGAALFALKSRVNIIPVGIKSNYKLFSRININIGKPIDINKFEVNKMQSENLSLITENIMNEVKILVNN